MLFFKGKSDQKTAPPPQAVFPQNEFNTNFEIFILFKIIPISCNKAFKVGTKPPEPGARVLIYTL